MSAGSPTAVAAPPSAPTTTTPADTTTLRRAPPAWLTAEKLTTERAHQLLDDLLAPCPSPDADAETHRADAQRKKFALLVFAMGAGKRPENTASPPQGATAPVLNPPKDKGVADETKDVRADDAFAGAVARCLAHRNRDVRILTMETLVTIAERDELCIVPHVPELLGLLQDPDDALLVLAAFRKDTFPKSCRAAADAACAAPDPDTIETGTTSAFDLVAASLAAQCPNHLQRNLPAMQLVNELGANVVWVHRERIAAFLDTETKDAVQTSSHKSAEEKDAVPSGLGNEMHAQTNPGAMKRKRGDDETRLQKMRAVQPKFGFVLCELSLRALSKCPEAASLFVEEARVYTESTHDATRLTARGLVDLVTRRDGVVRNEMIAHGNEYLRRDMIRTQSDLDNNADAGRAAGARTRKDKENEEDAATAVTKKIAEAEPAQAATKRDKSPAPGRRSPSSAIFYGTGDMIDL